MKRAAAVLPQGLDVNVLLLNLRLSDDCYAQNSLIRLNIS